MPTEISNILQNDGSSIITYDDGSIEKTNIDGSGSWQTPENIISYWGTDGNIIDSNIKQIPLNKQNDKCVTLTDNSKTMEYKLHTGLAYTLNSMSRGRDGYDIQNKCNIANNTVSIDANGDCFLCKCDGWLPLPVGNIMDFTTLSDIWTNTKSKFIQNDINEQKYSFCAVEQCGILMHNLESDLHIFDININLDNSCNLCCPSCREYNIMETSGDKFDLRKLQMSHLHQLIQESEMNINISMLGSGDPFASLIMRPFFKQWKYDEKIKLTIMTNGLLLRKQLTNVSVLRNLTNLNISVDAGSKDIYEIVRKPGKWEVLIDNLAYIKVQSRIYDFSIKLNFVLYKDNVNDIEHFIKLCDAYNIDGIITRINDWGTFNNFDDVDVLSQNNKLYNYTCQKIIDITKKYGTKYFGPDIKIVVDKLM